MTGWKRQCSFECCRNDHRLSSATFPHLNHHHSHIDRHSVCIPVPIVRLHPCIQAQTKSSLCVFVIEIWTCRSSNARRECLISRYEQRNARLELCEIRTPLHLDPTRGQRVPSPRRAHESAEIIAHHTHTLCSGWSPRRELRRVGRAPIRKTRSCR